MDKQEQYDLLSQVGEEIVTEDELKALLASKKELIAYDGFEPSGKVHIAQGLLRAITINKLTRASVKFKMLVADWHGWANNKMGGDLAKIRAVGRYMIEIWKACGLDIKNVDFVWANEFVNDPEYWKLVMEIARNNTVKRIIRCSQIMGRSESDSLQASQILYPCMQCADIFYLKANITQLGMDQRKVNMLAREIGPKLGFGKPVVISHHMLMGLTEPPKTDNTVERAMAMKMSKSKPDSAIFMTDTEEQITKKMNKAFCPEGIIEENPVLEYCKYIIFEKLDSFDGSTFVVERPEKWGGTLEYKNYADLEKDFKAKQLHPADLKQATAKHINLLLEPVRDYFEKNNEARKLKEAAESLEVTR